MTDVLVHERSATEPPEARGLQRDEVRLLVASARGIEHRRFTDLPDALQPGDVLVVNTSATIPAAVEGTRADGEPVVVHFSNPTHRGDPTWTVELRRTDAAGPVLDGRPGEVVRLPSSARVVLRRPVAGPAGGPRLWEATAITGRPVPEWLHEHGRPIRYHYVPEPWPLETYQTMFARHPGSAEMPSAGRPFTPRVVAELVARGVVLAPIVLHTGVSSLEAGEPPQPERFEVPATTADLIEHARRRGSRIIAVGTTAVRAIESAAGPEGTVRAAAGWTDLILGDARPARVIDGLITGWHEQGASHLDLLRAVVGHDLVEQAYAAARTEGYRWHEFGDSALLLPG